MRPLLSSARVLGQYASRTGSTWKVGSASSSLLTEKSLLCCSRSLSSKANKKTVQQELSYTERKQLAKKERTANYHEVNERKEKRKTRRDGKIRGEKQEGFRSFFTPKRVHEQRMNRWARQAGLDWKINVAVILERENVLLPEKKQWEIDYEELDEHLSNFGKVLPDYWRFGPSGHSESEKVGVKDDDFVDEQRVYETEADLSGNTRTIDRKLDQYVFLVVKEGESSEWQLPLVEVQDGETLAEAARRALDAKLGPSVQYYCPSTAPMGVDLVALPEEERSNAGVYGTKTFFMRLNHYEGDLEDATTSVKDFAWLNREEMSGCMEEQHGQKIGKYYQYLI
mmetsp:Transcript_13642/g.17778  ORF Transcript_13642/g.17778 Transcript_13642/m.17778 type:complete len:340 (+) Transcript_13642:172-1191(+)|eukprot:CAMPEP_0198136856 /NCGR_PEP_ID=MMETSP1443-20131203/425_1 /TAXON_ID=186043 /ORGANISM="Entomoneis sp., Strain CCMP2396" /LENGTH=339 /DNA_ID=CAMNT_0043798137 /DNA_START=117 /DNA_END=1136 /DNA_ORIENTATION=-